MPWIGAEPYEQLQLASYEPKLSVPVSDDICWLHYPKLNWLYNRLEIARVQELNCAPCGVDPFFWPVIVKPVINLTGMSQGVEVVSQPKNLDERAGSFWCEVLPDPQYSVDVLVHKGQIKWLAATKCYELRPGVFRAFAVGIKLPNSIREVIVGFIDCYLSRYVGALNFELRDGSVIEMHLRPSLQFLEFYGSQFVEQWARLVDQDNFEPPPQPQSGWSIPVYDEWESSRLGALGAASKVFTGDDIWHPPGMHRTGYVNATDQQLAIRVAKTLGTSYF